jgi:hypothetical protein
MSTEESIKALTDRVDDLNERVAELYGFGSLEYRDLGKADRAELSHILAVRKDLKERISRLRET